LIRRVLLAGLLAATLATPTAASASVSASPPLSPLHRAGGSIVDADGRVVLLHGVNTVVKSPPFYPPDAPGGLTDADLDRIAAHGFDVIRLGVIPEGLMPTKGHVDTTYIDHIAETIDRIAAHGLYVLLDIHQDLLGPPWGNGFPAWSIHHDPLLEATEPNLGFPLNALRPSHSLAWDAFWADTLLAPGDPKGPIGYLTDSIGALADRVGHDPAVAGIEIINEPWPGTAFLTCAVTVAVGCPVVDQYVQATWQRLTDRIRVSAPNLLVWWQPNSTWNETAPSSLGQPPFTPAITDPEVGFAFHDYCAFGELSTYLALPSALQVGCDAYHELTWANAATMRARTGLPQLVTEFGNIDDPVELARSLTRSDATFTGWQYWHWGQLSAGQLGQLVRTYPTATAGAPGPYSFDPATGEMHYRYIPGTQPGPTTIAVSDVHYPTGYAVAVDGGRITSAAGARVITVEAAAGATSVAVTVRRAPASAPTTTVAAAPPPPATGPVGSLPATGWSVGWTGWLLLGAAVALRYRRPSQS
jgi:endoglycosylceramidase